MITKYNFFKYFIHLFLVPQDLGFPSPGGIHYLSSGTFNLKTNKRFIIIIINSCSLALDGGKNNNNNNNNANLSTVKCGQVY